MRLKLLWCSGIVLPLSLGLAAQSSLIGPVEGFVFDAPSHGVRAVVGLLGSSSLGPILVRRVEYASIAPRKDYGITFSGGQEILVSALGSGTPVSVALPSTVRSQAEGVVWSGDGSVAVLYSRSGNWIQPVSGFPGQPAPASSIDLTPLGGPLAVVAADASGQRIAVGMGGDAGGVYELDPSHGFIPMLPTANPVSLGFSDDGLTLYALDGATAQISAVSVTGFGPQSFPLNGLTDPIAIALARDSANRQQIFVAGRQDRALQTYDASSQQLLATVPLAFEPSGISVFGAGSYILAPRASATDPLWSFRAAPAPGAVYFVPAAPLAPPEGRRK